MALRRALAVVLMFAVSASSVRIITRSMIRRAEDSGSSYERLALLEPRARTEGTSGAAADLSGRNGTPRGGTGNRSDPAEDLQQRAEETTPSTVVDGTEPPTDGDDALSQSDYTEIHDNTSVGMKRTRLYPVARLWERQESDIWSLLRAAYYCLFSSIDCFTERVYPMFRSYLGIKTSHEKYPFLLPRKSEADEEVSRSLMKTWLLKELLVGIILVQASLLPWLSGVSLASGKALLTGFLSLGAAGAVAALNSPTHYYM